MSVTRAIPAAKMRFLKKWKPKIRFEKISASIVEPSHCGLEHIEQSIGRLKAHCANA